VDHSTLTIPFYPADMWREESKIDAKDYFELQAYIKAEREKGSDLIEIMEVEHHKRTAFPISTVILTFIGVSLSSRKSRGGVGLQMALGLLLCFIYIGMQYVFATLAKTGFTYPWLAVWFPNLIFAIIAMFIYKRAQQ
jgi:lipopolysaccharide export system permease protein